MARLILARRSLLPALVCVLSLGCGDGTYRVSGKVTFKGQPVPAGKIYFIPDASKGNSGATGFADIRDGAYDTSAEGGRGVIAGPMIVAIEGLDPNAPPDKPTKGEKGERSEDVSMKLLFARYETTADLPKSTSTKDFEVPADAGKGPVEPKKDPKIIIP